MGLLVSLVLLEQLEPKVRRVLPEILDQQGQLEFKVLQARLEAQLVRLALLESTEPQVLLGQVEL